MLLLRLVLLTQWTTTAILGLILVLAALSYRDDMCYFSWTGWWLTAGYPLCSLTLMLKVVIVTNQILLTEKKKK